jgi:hypothetical protein
MSILDTLFTNKPGDLFHVAKIGICELLISPRSWICRIGLRQWYGNAEGLEHAKKLAIKCMGDQLREPATLLMKLKKAGEI